MGRCVSFFSVIKYKRPTSVYTPPHPRPFSLSFLEPSSCSQASQTNTLARTKTTKAEGGKRGRGASPWEMPVILACPYNTLLAELNDCIAYKADNVAWIAT